VDSMEFGLNCSYEGLFCILCMWEICTEEDDGRFWT